MSMAVEIPFHLEFELGRRQRLVPHLRIWMWLLLIGFIVIVGSVVGMGTRWWLFPLPLFVLWLMRGFFIGLIDIALVRVKQMAIMVEKKGMRITTGGERWWIFLDGVISVEQLLAGVWTICHRNGQVICIPVSEITLEQLEHIKEAAARGKAWERVLAVIKQGKKIEKFKVPSRQEMGMTFDEVHEVIVDDLSEQLCPDCGERFGRESAESAAEEADRFAKQEIEKAKAKGYGIRIRVLYPLDCSACGGGWYFDIGRRTFTQRGSL